MKKLAVITIMGLGLAASSASAATYNLDFGALPGEGGYVDGSTIAVGGQNVTVSAYNVAIAHSGTGWTVAGVSSAPFAYLDGPSNAGNPAGLGVCQNLNGSAGNGTPGGECNPSSDDNITAYSDPQQNVFDEVLALSFAEDRYIDSMWFRDADHLLAFPQDANSEVLIGVLAAGDPAAHVGSFSLIAGSGVVNTGGYRLNAGDILFVSYANEQMYLNGMTVSSVPIPAAGFLLMGALGGLGFVGRRRRKVS